MLSETSGSIRIALWNMSRFSFFSKHPENVRSEHSTSTEFRCDEFVASFTRALHLRGETQEMLQVNHHLCNR